MRELVDYIKKARSLGSDDRSIVEILLDAGWHSYQIKEAFLAERDTNATEEIIIDTSSVSKSYGKFKALEDINFTLKKGEILALLGPNGAGKTTLIKILTTLLKPDTGKVNINGFDLEKQPAKLRSVIGLAGQHAAVDENLNGYENLELVASLYHLNRKEAKEKAKLLIEKFRLTDAGKKVVKTYSGGMRRRLDLAASLIGRPQVLFLDEPTTGLDPRSRIELWDVIKELAAEGTSILLTTQYLEEADHLADSIIVIDKGRIIARGTAKELKSKVGGEILEIHITDHSRIPQAAHVLEKFALEKPHIDAEVGKISFPLNGGAASITNVVRSLDAENLVISDLSLRHPTLDDVFLNLTSK